MIYHNIVSTRKDNFYRCRSILAHVYLLVDSYMSNNKFD